MRCLPNHCFIKSCSAESLVYQSNAISVLRTYDMVLCLKRTKKTLQADVERLGRGPRLQVMAIGDSQKHHKKYVRRTGNFNTSLLPMHRARYSYNTMDQKKARLTYGNHNGKTPTTLKNTYMIIIMMGSARPSEADSLS